VFADNGLSLVAAPAAGMIRLTEELI